MATHFKTLLANVAALGRGASALAAPIRRLALLPEAELHTVIHGFNDTKDSSFPSDTPFHVLFSQAAHQWGNRMAVEDGRATPPISLTFTQLDQASDQLCLLLQGKHGVGKGCAVLIAMDRSACYLMAMLAILKCGGVYVPVAEDHVGSKARYVIEDCKARVVLTLSHAKDKVTAPCKTNTHTHS